jgi:hypothetical protein
MVQCVEKRDKKKIKLMSFLRLFQITYLCVLFYKKPVKTSIGIYVTVYYYIRTINTIDENKR